jgi:hypothetical protein
MKKDRERRDIQKMSGKRVLVEEVKRLKQK